jgi:sensor domain CHASE-containing protein
MKWHHSIERRLVLIFVFAMALTFAVMTSLSLFAGFQERIETEEKRVEKSMSVALNLLGNQIDDIEHLAKDYAYWDEMYNFIDEPKLEFVKSSLDMDSIDVADLNGLIVHDRSGEALYRISTYDFITDSQLWGEFDDGTILKGKQVQRGSIFLKGRILAFVSHEVSDNSGSRVSNGRITVFREIDQRMMDQISRGVGEAFNLVNMSQPDAITTIVYRDVWRVEKSEVIFDDDLIKGTYSLFLSDELTLPVLAEIQIARERFHMSSLWRWLVPQIFLLALLTFFLLMLLRATITRPIKGLVAWLNQVNGSQLAEDLRPYSYSQYGEIGVLSDKFSEIYNNLYQQHQFSQLLLYSISDFIFTVDAQGKIDYCNPAAAEWLKIDSKELYKQDFELLFASVDEDAPSVANWLYRALETYSEFSGQLNIRKLSEPNKTYFLEIQVSPILYNDTEQKGAMIILRLKK